MVNPSPHVTPGVPVLAGAALQAVQHRGSHVQIIASAGSGKTEVVSQRVVELLAEGVAPEAIVAFTFTERAAEELKNRITDRIGRRRSPVMSKSSFAWTYRRRPFRVTGTGMNDSLGRRPSSVTPVGPCGPSSKCRCGGSYGELRIGLPILTKLASLPDSTSPPPSCRTASRHVAAWLGERNAL